MLSVPLVKIVEITRFERHFDQYKTENKSTFVLSCRLNGESLFIYENKEYKVNVGDILFIPLGATYSQSCKYEELVYFHFETVSEMPKDLCLWKSNDKQLICSLFNEAAKKWSEKSEGYEFYCVSLFYKILSLIKFHPDDSNKNVNKVIKPALDYLNSHMFDEDFSLSKTCRQSYISRTYFNKIFFKEFGCAPIDFVQKSRIDKAKFLLKSGNYSNTEIANICGYSDVKYFYSVFHKLTGYTTKEYKALADKQT